MSTTWSRRMAAPALLAVVVTVADTSGVSVAATAPTTARVAPTRALVVSTAAWSPVSPDPSGIVYLPGDDRLLTSDGEVDEMPVYAGANLYTHRRDGALQGTGTTVQGSPVWSREPTGLAFNPANGHLFVSDDDKKAIFEIAGPGGDGLFGTTDDGKRTQFSTRTFNSLDPEGVDYDTSRDQVLIIDGLGNELYRVDPGANGAFDGEPPVGDDTVTHIDTQQFGIVDPEGIAYDAQRDMVLVLDNAAIWELDEHGSLLDSIGLTEVKSLTGVAVKKAAGLTIGPASDGSGATSYYVVDRGVDNNTRADENDGRMFEITVGAPGSTNQRPAVSAGPDQTVDLTSTASLSGTVRDDGKPTGSTTVRWFKVSGPGTVTFARPSSANTTATFSAGGRYVLRLTANDSQLTTSDDVVVDVAARDVPQLVATLTRSHVPLGTGTDIPVTISPSVAGQQLRLQRWNGTSWPTVRTVVTRSGKQSYGFAVKPAHTGLFKYRVVAAAFAGRARTVAPGADTALVLRVYRAAVTRVVHTGSEPVTVRNTGTVRISLAGWTLRNDRTGRGATLPTFDLGAGRVVRIHTGAGTTDRDDLFLGRRNMWGAHGTAVLRDRFHGLADRFRY